MDVRQQQARIDAITWYHEFDFGNGLKARPVPADLQVHRPVWEFIEHHLSKIDFRNKTVLDIGCWDGYWSFYAERRGAKSVLATDDRTQNWADGRGLLLARELYGSRIEVNQDISIYELASLKRKFDIILCMGVYYHLLDPFYGFAQLRHCCHRDTIMAIEGAGASASMRPNGVIVDLSNLSNPIYLPTANALNHVLKATYLSVTSQASLSDLHKPPRLGWRWRLGMCTQALAGSRPGVGEMMRPLESQHGRLFTMCKPFEGANDYHCYVPPFGLHVYDDRYRTKAVA